MATVLNYKPDMAAYEKKRTKGTSAPRQPVDAESGANMQMFANTVLKSSAAQPMQAQPMLLNSADGYGRTA